jgi:transketolase
MWNLCINGASKELRAVFVESLQQLMDENEKVIAIEADLGAASGFSKIGKSHRSQFINIGIAEANMIGVAAGLSMTGFIPFVHSFAPFAVRKGYDQLYLSCGYSGNTINIYGSDPGVCSGTNGGTHTTFEDIALMRAIPGTMIFDPADPVQLKWLIREVSGMSGIHYIRVNRKAVPCIYEEGSSFEIGKGNIIFDGKDVLLIAMGETLYPAYEAALELNREGIGVEVIDMFTVKPLDRELIRNELRGKKLIVTFENHSTTGGLGSAIAELLAEDGIGVPLRRIGINEEFGQVGPPDYLKRIYVFVI